MSLKTLIAFTLASLAATSLALPAVPQALLIGNAGQAALNWGAGAVSRVGDGGVRTATRWEWNDCGEATDAIQIKSLRVSPDPPKPGHNLTIYASGTVTDLIDDGAYADVVVKLGLIKLLTKRFDVCEELGNANATLQCPVQPDDYTIEQTVELPQEIPRAKFQVSTRAFTQLDQPMACIDIMINFLLPDNVEA